jgi:hypothetical protein
MPASQPLDSAQLAVATAALDEAWTLVEHDFRPEDAEAARERLATLILRLGPIHVEDGHSLAVAAAKALRATRF